MLNRLHPNHPYQQRYRRVDLAPKIKATDALTAFLKELEVRVDAGLVIPEGLDFRGYRIRTFEAAEWVKNTISKPPARHFNSLLAVQSYHQYWQRWDYLPSNLGKGYVFFFICDRCESRVRGLYMPDGLFRYLCRICHRLAYPARSQRLINQPHEVVI